MLGSNFLEAGLPVFPADIRIGARHNDGKGALQLLTEMKDNPERFLPRNHSIVAQNLLALSLDSPLWEIERVAHAIAWVLADEMIDRSEPDRSDADVERSVVDQESDSEPSPKRGISGKAGDVLSKVPIIAQTAHHAFQGVPGLHGDVAVPQVGVDAELRRPPQLPWVGTETSTVPGRRV